jgi:hypothetical protein
VYYRRQQIIIANQMSEYSMQLSCIVLGIAIDLARILMQQDDDDTHQEINNDESEHPGQPTCSSNIEEDDLGIQQEVPHQDQMHRDKTIRSTTVPLLTKLSHANTVNAYTPLPNLRHQVGAIAPL